MGIEAIVAGYLFAWGVKRAKAVGDTAGAITDKALQAALTRLETVVRNRLGTNEAIEDLDEETNAAAADGSSAAPAALSEDTHDALVRSLKRAAKKDPDFAATLAEALTAVQAADPASTAGGGVTSHGGGTTAGGNITITASGTGSTAISGNAGDVNAGGINIGIPTPSPKNRAPSSGTPTDPHTPGPHQS